MIRLEERLGEELWVDVCEAVQEYLVQKRIILSCDFPGLDETKKNPINQ